MKHYQDKKTDSLEIFLFEPQIWGIRHTVPAVLIIWLMFIKCLQRNLPECSNISLKMSHNSTEICRANCRSVQELLSNSHPADLTGISGFRRTEKNTVTVLQDFIVFCFFLFFKLLILLLLSIMHICFPGVCMKTTKKISTIKVNYIEWCQTHLN